jgi:hypothetical protein
LQSLTPEEATALLYGLGSVDRVEKKLTLNEMAAAEQWVRGLV